jgi:hypothetical protein
MKWVLMLFLCGTDTCDDWGIPGYKIFDTQKQCEDYKLGVNRLEIEKREYGLRSQTKTSECLLVQLDKLVEKH